MPLESAGDRGDDRPDDGWLTDQVHTALARLSADDRRILRLAYFGGLSQAQVARRLDIPLGTVKSRTARAHQRLAPLLSHVRRVA